LHTLSFVAYILRANRIAGPRKREAAMVEIIFKLRLIFGHAEAGADRPPG
jgi:hypothetical protein